MTEEKSNIANISADLTKVKVSIWRHVICREHTRHNENLQICETTLGEAVSILRRIAITDSHLRGFKCQSFCPTTLTVYSRFERPNSEKYDIKSIRTYVRML